MACAVHQRGLCKHMHCPVITWPSLKALTWGKDTIHYMLAVGSAGFAEASAKRAELPAAAPVPKQAPEESASEGGVDVEVKMEVEEGAHAAEEVSSAHAQPEPCRAHKRGKLGKGRWACFWFGCLRPLSLAYLCNNMLQLVL